MFCGALHTVTPRQCSYVRLYPVWVGRSHMGSREILSEPFWRTGKEGKSVRNRSSWPCLWDAAGAALQMGWKRASFLTVRLTHTRSTCSWNSYQHAEDPVPSGRWKEKRARRCRLERTASPRREESGSEPWARHTREDPWTGMWGSREKQSVSCAAQGHLSSVLKALVSRWRINGELWKKKDFSSIFYKIHVLCDF